MLLWEFTVISCLIPNCLVESSLEESGICPSELRTVVLSIPVFGLAPSDLVFSRTLSKNVDIA